MKSINITLDVSPKYSNQFVEIKTVKYKLGFSIEKGVQKVMSPVFEIGVLKYLNNTPLLAQLVFTYEYNEKQRTITLCGSDFNSSDSMCLTTFPKGSKEVCHQSPTNLRIGNKKQMYNPNWNINTQMTPDLESGFRNIVINANNRLIDEFKKIKGCIIRVRTSPPKSSPDNALNLLVVYRKKRFAGFFDPEKKYDKDTSILSLESVWGGTVKFSQGENFANVIGSTPDPHIAGKSWLQLWTDQFGVPALCSSYQYKGFLCNTFLLGGHVILGKVAQAVPKGSNSVYIMPICNAHNNNDNVYMAALQYTDGIWLNNYLN